MNHSTSNHWLTTHEKVLKCVACNGIADGLAHIADMLPDDPERKTYIFYQFSQKEGAITIGLKGVTDSSEEGTPLFPMLQRLLARDSDFCQFS